MRREREREIRREGKKIGRWVEGRLVEGWEESLWRKAKDDKSKGECRRQIASSSFLSSPLLASCHVTSLSLFFAYDMISMISSAQRSWRNISHWYPLLSYTCVHHVLRRSLRSFWPAAALTFRERDVAWEGLLSNEQIIRRWLLVKSRDVTSLTSSEIRIE